MRRYDIDWLRVIAIGLLLIYHVAIGFQPWGGMIAFITNTNPWPDLWTPMMLINIWRIPLLFFVSGMGVYFAMEKRNWKQLLSERAKRILLPFVFGMFAIVPIHLLILRYHFNLALTYTWDPGHLWFLGNIFAYVVVLSPILFYLKHNDSGKVVRAIQNVLRHPLGLLVVVTLFCAEVYILGPVPFELYARTWHGFFMGLLAFFCGFSFVLSGPPFWQMIQKYRWLFLVVAVALFGLRVFYLAMSTPYYAIVVESLSWILTVLAFGSLHLNKPGRALTYLSEAAYPVYIVHMIFLYLGSHLIFQLAIPAPLQFVLLLVFTLAGCFGAFEVMRRLKWVRPLLGLKVN